jgi:ornithine cyclodeaminase
MAAAIGAVEEAFVSVVDQTADQPQRISLTGGAALGMLAGRRGVAGAITASAGTVMKVVSILADNPSRGLPAVNAIALCLDGETGRPAVLVDGTSLTSLRTGAATGLATRLLAPPQARVLAMIGAGGQSADQIRAVCEVRPIAEVRVYSPSGVSARRVAAQLTEELERVTVVAVESVEAAVDHAEVICCATGSTTPVVPEPLGPEVHINAMGSYRPDMREIPPSLLAGASLIAVDHREAVLAEAGELIDAVRSGLVHPEDLVELGTLVHSPPARRGITIFKSVGIAMQDWAICNLLHRELDGDGVPWFDPDTGRLDC